MNEHPELGYYDEGLDLVKPKLYAAATKHENIYRHKWRVGDVLMWDNRAAMHYACYDYDDTMPRKLHRTTAGGDVPV